MVPLQYGKRADRQNFRPDDNPWNLDLTFQLEKECIYDEMERTAGNLRSKNGFDEALAYADTMMDKIRDSYCAFNDPPPTIWKKAIKEELHDECPKNGKIIGFRIAFWIALLAEIVVMGVQAAMSGEVNPFIFVLAIILGLGGFLQGLGIGNLLFIKWKNGTGRPHSAPATRDWILLVIGSILILLVSTVRGASGIDIMQFLLVFMVTLFFGEAVAICEASAVDLSCQRDQCQQDMANCQKVQASQNHSKNLDEGVYRRDYEVFVNNSEKKKYQKNPEVEKNVSAEPSPQFKNP